ncbi:hypothetical protein MHTCC0001_16680 [Flavobacteriaceae bacterium MHTCC 0001]
MNRKYTVLVWLCLALSYTAQSQTKTSITAIAGYSDEGIAALTNFQIYLGQTFKNYYEVGLYTGFLKETQSDYNIPLNIYTVNGGYHFRIDEISAKSNAVVTTLGLGGVIGLETLNKGNGTLPDGALIESKDGLIYGAYGALETDIYLSDNWSLLGRYTHFYHTNSEMGKSKFMVGVGIKYIFI